MLDTNKPTTAKSIGLDTGAALRLEKDTGAAVVEEMECSTPDVAYCADHFNYQIFSGTTTTVNGLRNRTASFARPGMIVRQLIYKLRSINWNSAKQQLFSKKNSIIHLILKCVFILLFIFVLTMLFVDRKNISDERWLRNHQCQSFRCLKAAGLLREKMNISVSPCDNFYQYACGHHFRPHQPTTQPDTPAAQGSQAYHSGFKQRTVMHLNKEKSGRFLRVHRPAIDHLTHINTHAIISGLDHIYSTQYTKRGSAKFKVAQWYQSCTHRTMRDWLGTRSFISTVAPAIGGIWILDKNATKETGANGNTNSTAKWPNQMFRNYDISTNIPMKPYWSWMNAAKKLQAILHVPVFVDFNVQPTPGSEPQVFFVPDSASWMTAGYFSYYEQYISKLFQQLGLESGIPFGDSELSERIKQAVNDIRLIGTKIYQMSRNAYSKSPERVSLGQLNKGESVFDWKGLLSHYFDEVDLVFDDGYFVYSQYANYLKQVPELIMKLQNDYSTPVFNRIINNYMLWNTMDAYAWHLSYEMAAIQHWHYTNLDSDLQADCLLLTHEMFGTVLGAIFVENHLNDDAANHTKKMLTYLKSSAREQIQKTKWLDYDTRQKLERRIENMEIKYTIPDIMTNEAKLDYAYRKLKTSYVYMENLLSAVAYIRTLNNRVLAGVADQVENDWLNYDVSVYDAKIGVHLVDDQLYVPLGALQPPVYHHNLPADLNFAGFGSMIGTAVARLLGEMGSYKIKQDLELIWSDKSWNEYLVHWQCVRNQIGNATKKMLNGSFLLSSQISQDLDAATSLVIDDSTGLMISQRALEQWTNVNGNSQADTLLPGEYMAKQKLFYTSYAQTFCDATDGDEQSFQLLYGSQGVPFEILVNHIISETTEFAAAFNCPVGSKMNPRNRCSAPL
ncbi:hypothetical protein CRM22_009590 [Opisthorchis felineus]|uniref:Peptidase M13 N-terminal domain-containing protein n=1 Tax=Opisthorchis felineus TaxID=147828 RepID=A0A4V3SCZ4_OPIFE|nr:hypothetical protein CRM22_009590 [Opisthorchis felineus]